MPPKKKVVAPEVKTARSIMDAVNTAMGREVLKPGSDPSFATSFIPTGLLPFDVLMSGGLPRGRSVMIVGDYSTLKSLVGLCAIASCQQRGGVAGLIDTERTFDPEWAEECGVNVDDLVMYPPKDADPGEFFPGELAMDAMEAMTRAGIDLVVVDSIAATLPQDEQNKRLFDENQQPARLAALMSKAFRKLTSANSNTAYLWINQFRMQVGMTFGDPNIATGGKAAGYFASYIIVVRKGEARKQEVKKHSGKGYKTVKRVVAQEFHVTMTKSKLSSPFGEVYFDWNLKEGRIDIPLYLMSEGINTGLIKHKAQSYTYKGKKVVGKDAMRKLIDTDPKIARDIENAVRREAGIPELEVPKAKKARRSLKR